MSPSYPLPMNLSLLMQPSHPITSSRSTFTNSTQQPRHRHTFIIPLFSQPHSPSHTLMPNNVPELTPPKSFTTTSATHPIITSVSTSPPESFLSALSHVPTLPSTVSYAAPALTAQLVNTTIPRIHHPQQPRHYSRRCYQLLPPAPPCTITWPTYP